MYSPAKSQMWPLCAGKFDETGNSDMFWEELGGHWEEIDIQDNPEKKAPSQENALAQRWTRCRIVAIMIISAAVLPILVGAVLFFAASEGSSMVAPSERQTDQIHDAFEEQSDENYNGVNRNLNSDISVQTNQIYEHSSSLYQKLMVGRRKVDPKMYQQQDIGDSGKDVGFFRRLINAKNKIGDGFLLQVTDIFHAASDSDGLVMIKEAIKTIMETVLHAIINGFLPTVERVRRDADGDKRTYLDMLSSLVGAVIGRQSCGDVIACRMGKWFQGRLPAAQLVVMMVESVVPAVLLEWFGVVKKSVIDRSDNCDLDYECSLQDD